MDILNKEPRHGPALSWDVAPNTLLVAVSLNSRGAASERMKIPSFATSACIGSWVFSEWFISGCERRQSELANHVDRQKEMMRIVEQGSEPKLQVEVPGRFIDRIDFDRPDSDLSREVFSPA